MYRMASLEKVAVKSLCCLFKLKVFYTVECYGVSIEICLLSNFLHCQIRLNVFGINLLIMNSIKSFGLPYIVKSAVSYT